MKYALLAPLLLLAAGCSQSGTSVEAPKKLAASPPTEQEAISAYLKTELDDPASYQPAKFVVDGVWTRKDSVSLPYLNKGKLPPKYLAADSIVPAGHRYYHEFRAKNKVGALELMKKEYIVYAGNKVVGFDF